ncbi:hypothetical protein ACLB2K_023451 [Fragaria x ananassa]
MALYKSRPRKRKPTLILVVARARRNTPPSCILAWTLSSEEQYGAATFQNLRSSRDWRVLSSKSCIDEEIHVTVMPATIVPNAFEDVPLHVAKANLSSDDSNYENVDNMVIGNFVSNKSKRKYMSSEWSEYINKIGQVFVGVAIEFRQKLCKFAIEKGFLFDYAKNDNLRVSATCSKKESEKCEWYIYVSIEKASGFFVIRKSVNTHSCLGIVRHENHKKLGSKVISSIIVDKVKSDPLIKPTNIVKNFKEEYGLVIPYYMTYRGKDYANDLFNGSEALGYALLPWYIDALKRTNPDSYCILDSIEGRFRRLFICYGACLKGFQYCQPMLFIDGTFIKNKYKGVLLSACAETVTKEIFQFAFAVVDT